MDQRIGEVSNNCGHYTVSLYQSGGEKYATVIRDEADGTKTNLTVKSLQELPRDMAKALDAQFDSRGRFPVDLANDVVAFFEHECTVHKDRARQIYSREKQSIPGGYSDINTWHGGSAHQTIHLETSFNVCGYRYDMEVDSKDGQIDGDTTVRISGKSPDSAYDSPTRKTKLSDLPRSREIQDAIRAFQQSGTKIPSDKAENIVANLKGYNTRTCSIDNARR